MNTAIQVKTHTRGSAKLKSQHNERKDNHIKNPNFVILSKNIYHKFENDKISKPKTTAKLEAKEQALKKELATIQSKINTYQKRVLEYEARENPNFKQIDKIKAKIEDLKLQKEKIPQLSDKRGKPQKIRYVEFELSLTNSSIHKHDKHIQNAFYNAVKELKKDEIFKDLKSVSDIMHLDQYSLHIHSINKIKNGKTWRDIVLENFDKGTECYEHLQKRFNDLVRNEMTGLGYEIEIQEKGKKYLPLAEYKKITNFNEDDNIDDDVIDDDVIDDDVIDDDDDVIDDDDDVIDDDVIDDDDDVIDDDVIDDDVIDDDFDFNSLIIKSEETNEKIKNIDIFNIKDKKEDEKEDEKEDNEIIKKSKSARKKQK